MIFYSVWNGEERLYFNTKKEALYCAKKISKVYDQVYSINYYIYAERIDIGKITRSKILRILRQNAWVTERTTIWSNK